MNKYVNCKRRKMHDFEQLLDKIPRISSKYSGNDDSSTSSALSDISILPNKENIMQERVENLVDLPCKSTEYVVQFLKERLHRKQFNIWVGKVLMLVHPCGASLNQNTSNKSSPSIDAVVERVWFNLTKKIGKKNQAIVFSGDSGSGKTYSSCLALKSLANKNNSEFCDVLFWQVSSSVLIMQLILSAFGNASTQHNSNSSRFGRLLKLQYNEGKIIGGKIETFLLEKSRVTGPNQGEGNFHIFKQVLFNLEDSKLKKLMLSRDVSYKICPDVPSNMSFEEMMKAFKLLKIEEVDEILTVVAIILNLGNVEFEFVENNFTVTDGNCQRHLAAKEQSMCAPSINQNYNYKHAIYEIIEQLGNNHTLIYNLKMRFCFIGSAVFLNNAAKLLETDNETLLELLTNKMLNSALSPRKRRITCYKTSCTIQAECIERLNCFMRYLYDSLFSWIVDSINKLIYKADSDQMLGILDIYGFEVFTVNSFEQLCINYANERLQQYFARDHLFEYKEDLIAESIVNDYDVEYGEYFDRVAVIDGSVSIFSILDEECLMKRFNTDTFVNNRLTAALKGNQYFVASKRDYSSHFSIKHFAGFVNYNTKDMLLKNRDKVPEEMISFLQNECSFSFMEKLVDKPKVKGLTTLLKKFKSSLDSLMKTLDDCDVHYVKCIKSNPQQEKNRIDEKYLMEQLNVNGIFDILKIHFQEYFVKLPYSQFEDIISIDLLSDISKHFELNYHIGRKFIYLSEETYLFLEQLSSIRKNIAARTIQKAFIKYKNGSQTKDTLQVSKKSNSIDISVHDGEYVIPGTYKQDPRKKVQEYIEKHSNFTHCEGDTISLILEKALSEITTKTFERKMYFGSGIVSYQRLLKVPIRFHLSKSCIVNSHVLPRSEVPKGLQDIL